ncbi:hypothetical protein K3N28_04195 [Glycomyces sp. TRM65418]|uniref:hypothetical protein n=1 Tax=Glycomyces sp. TRM65418 TaxID=2867006 RepID=UPI001CE5D2D8|nr:hypothetical protein [Glycomyces sp. TRM65418]MCC3762270.1 hypothetical protein [Glycomyces sp. TRM65418]QZD56327.1 hypothetical protein K3N28_04165 [Glycomyces sp. TRM65418]
MSPKGIAQAAPPTPRIATRRTAFAVLAIAAALPLSACGEVPTGTLHTRAGYTVASEEVPVSVCPAEDESRFAGDEGLLIGPHFALRVECVASFDAIPEGFQLEYLLGEDTSLYSPEPGHEFTLVQFAPDPGVEVPYPNDDLSGLSATLSIGDRTWDFEGEAPVPGAVYFTVAEKDAAVTLEVVDNERTQTMDLRARTKEGLIQALYHGSTFEVNTDPATGSVDGYTTSGSYEYWFDDWKYSTQFTVTREVFEPGTGWVAEPDRAVLGVEFGWLHSGSGLEWAIDPQEALKVTGPEGDLTALTAEHVDEEWNGGVWRTFTLKYDVPADALAFTLNFHPEGPVKWPEEDISLPITGDKNHEIAVSFE